MDVCVNRHVFDRLTGPTRSGWELVKTVRTLEPFDVESEANCRSETCWELVLTRLELRQHQQGGVGRSAEILE